MTRSWTEAVDARRRRRHRHRRDATSCGMVFGVRAVGSAIRGGRRRRRSRSSAARGRSPQACVAASCGRCAECAEDEEGRIGEGGGSVEHVGAVGAQELDRDPVATGARGPLLDAAEVGAGGLRRGMADCGWAWSSPGGVRSRGLSSGRAAHRPASGSRRRPTRRGGRPLRPGGAPLAAHRVVVLALGAPWPGRSARCRCGGSSDARPWPFLLDGAAGCDDGRVAGG